MHFTYLIFFSGEEADPGLSKFAKMMQCLQAQSSGGSIGNNWNQAPGGSFIPNWEVNNPNSLNKNPNNDWSRPGLNHNPNANPNINPKYGPDDWRQRERLNNPNSQLNNPNPNGYGPGQPQPGVHPDDWGRINVGPSEPSWTRRGKPAEPPPGIPCRFLFKKRVSPDLLIRTNLLER